MQYQLICSTCNEITGSGNCTDLQRAADNVSLATCSNGHQAIVLVAGGDTYTPAAPESPDPVEQYNQLFSGAVEAAQQKIINLKTQCCLALIAGGMDRDSAIAAGVQFAVHPTIKSAINDYELAGGHPLMAAAFKAAAQSVNPAWLSPEILALWDGL